MRYIKQDPNEPDLDANGEQMVSWLKYSEDGYPLDDDGEEVIYKKPWEK